MEGVGDRGGEEVRREHLIIPSRLLLPIYQDLILSLVFWFSPSFLILAAAINFYQFLTVMYNISSYLGGRGGEGWGWC